METEILFFYMIKEAVRSESTENDHKVNRPTKNNDLNNQNFSKQEIYAQVIVFTIWMYIQEYLFNSSMFPLMTLSLSFYFEIFTAIPELGSNITRTIKLFLISIATFSPLCYYIVLSIASLLIIRIIASLFFYPENKAFRNITWLLGLYSVLGLLLLLILTFVFGCFFTEEINYTNGSVFSARIATYYSIISTTIISLLIIRGIDKITKKAPKKMNLKNLILICAVCIFIGFTLICIMNKNLYESSKLSHEDIEKFYILKKDLHKELEELRSKQVI